MTNKVFELSVLQWICPVYPPTLQLGESGNNTGSIWSWKWDMQEYKTVSEGVMTVVLLDSCLTLGPLRKSFFSKLYWPISSENIQVPKVNKTKFT